MIIIRRNLRQLAQISYFCSKLNYNDYTIYKRMTELNQPLDDQIREIKRRLRAAMNGVLSLRTRRCTGERGHP